jgi:lipopolysaccharide export LptBFGC system permease protein LptF
MTELTQEQKADRFKNRRKMAWRSFYAIMVIGPVLIAFSLSSDAAAARVAASSPLITIVFGVWISIVLTYFGAASLSEYTGRI